MQEKIMLTLSLSGGLSATKRNLINFSHANFMRVIVIEREREREREYANNLQITCKYLCQNSYFPRYRCNISNRAWNYILSLKIHQL